MKKTLPLILMIVSFVIPALVLFFHGGLPIWVSFISTTIFLFGLERFHRQRGQKSKE
jgi:hypothetical protein